MDDEFFTLRGTGEDNNGTFTVSIQNLAYGYQPSTGNLLTRNDILNNRNEVFTYDALDRLLTAQLAGSATYNQTMIYQPNGNINVKSDIGTYLYESPKPNAMSGINGVYAGVSSDKQFIDYTTFNKVSEIRQGVDENTITKKYNIYYGLDEQRIKSVLSLPQGGGLVGATTRYYFGAYEKDIDRFGNATQTDYIYTPAGLTAMMKGGTLYYIHTDNLGSIQAITDESKNTVSSYYYTPWGARVLLSGVNITDRGYTFHEHLEPFCLINMNGRVYDPMLARFLSPDPYVQMPDYTQNFNRYSYCLNNPFKYTDPSGEFLTWNISSNGFSIGLNFTPIGIPLGFGINIGWSGSGSAGVYGEVGYRVGGTGLGAGVTASQSLDFGFNGNISTTSSLNVGVSFCGFNIGVGGSYNYNITYNQGNWGWNVGAGIGLGGNSYSSLGLGIGYGSGGFTFGLNGSYDYKAYEKLVADRNQAIQNRLNAELKAKMNKAISESLISIQNVTLLSPNNEILPLLTREELYTLRISMLGKELANIAFTEYKNGSMDWKVVGDIYTCNIFVQDMMRRLDMAPYEYNLLAGERANKNKIIPKWTIVTDGTLNAGDVVAYSYSYSHASGHMGIMYNSSQFIYAGSTSSANGLRFVNFNAYPNKSPWVVRRYLGNGY